MDVQIQVFDEANFAALNVDTDPTTLMVNEGGFDDDTAKVITGITILDLADNDVTGSFTISGLNTTTVTVDDLTLGFRVFVETADGYQRMEITNVDQGNDSFDLGGVGIANVQSGDPIDIVLDLTVSDEDDDSLTVADAPEQTINVTLLPQLTGTDGNDVLTSNGDGEFLVGGRGDDTLTGNEGADVFVFNLSVDDGDDAITDFDGSEDRLSFVDVTDGAGDDIADLDAMIASIVNDGGGDVQVNFTSGGSIVFENIAFASQTSIAELVDTDAQIMVDHV